MDPVESPPIGRRQPPRPQRPTARRQVIPIPVLARRGRVTLRHFSGLLFGGYVARVRALKARGRRGVLFALERLAAAILRIFVDRELVSLSFPEQLRRRLELLGPTYVKLGQILSMRRDILPEAVTEELANLLCVLPAVSFEVVAEVISNDLGQPFDRVFAQVDPEPVGSASIAQTHRAATHEGEAVLLKVVKPGIRDLLHRDAGLLRLFGVVLQVLLPRFQPRRVIDEFFEYTLREVEMLREADNAEAFAFNFRDVPDIVFPRVYRELSGPNMLCMEFFDGTRPDSAEARELPEEDRRRLIDLGALAIIRMLYEDGFFHADLHPANLLILPGPKVAFLDLGMVGRLDPELRHSLLYQFYSLVVEDYESAARHLSAVARVERDSDVVGFRRAVKELCRRWRRAATIEEFSLALLILESVRLGSRYRLYFPVEMVLLVKGLVTYEGLGYLMDPDFNVADVSREHVQRIFRLQFSPVRLLQQGLRGAPDMIDALSKVPLLVSESLRLLEQRTRQRSDTPTTGVRATLFGGACIVSGSILVGLGQPWPLWGGLLALGLVLSLRRR